MLCTHCGADLSAQSKFCPNCGHKQEEDSAEHSSKPGAAPAKSTPLWFKAIIALTALGLVLGSLATLMSEDATDIIEEQLQALKEDHITEAYYDYTAKGFRESTSLEQFRNFVKEHTAFIKNSSVEFTERNIDGDQGSLDAVLSSVNDTKTHINFHVVKEGNKWKVLSIRIEDTAQPGRTAPSTAAPVKPAAQPEAASDVNSPLLTPIKRQLSAIKEGDISAGYRETVSKKFAEKTSEKEFIDYIKTHPILTEYTSVSYSDVHRRGSNGSANALLKSTGGDAVINYEVIEEGGTWKIWSLHLEEHPSISALSDVHASSRSHIDGFDAAPLFDVIKQQLAAMRQRDLEKAYKGYTSVEFQSSTPFEAFAAFVNNQPPLSHNKGISFGDLTFDNNVAAVTGILQSEEGNDYRVEYSLVQDGDDWKIQHIQILPLGKSDPKPADSAASETPQSIRFSKFVLGTETDAQGIVLNPGKTFKEDSGDLYLNLYVANGVPDVKIEVLFTHVDSHSSIAPVSTKLSQTGETILSFVFSPPAQGWPKGAYRIQAKASSGEQDAFNFKVN